MSRAASCATRLGAPSSTTTTACTSSPSRTTPGGGSAAPTSHQPDGSLQRATRTGGRSARARSSAGARSSSTASSHRRRPCSRTPPSPGWWRATTLPCSTTTAAVGATAAACLRRGGGPKGRGTAEDAKSRRRVGRAPRGDSQGGLRHRDSYPLPPAGQQLRRVGDDCRRQVWLLRSRSRGPRAPVYARASMMEPLDTDAAGGAGASSGRGRERRASDEDEPRRRRRVRLWQLWAATGQRRLPLEPPARACGVSRRSRRGRRLVSAGATRSACVGFGTRGPVGAVPAAAVEETGRRRQAKARSLGRGVRVVVVVSSMTTISMTSPPTSTTARSLMRGRRAR